MLLRNHQAKATVAKITGTTTASMIVVALNRMFRWAAPISPLGGEHALARGQCNKRSGASLQRDHPAP